MKIINDVYYTGIHYCPIMLLQKRDNILIIIITGPISLKTQSSQSRLLCPPQSGCGRGLMCLNHRPIKWVLWMLRAAGIDGEGVLLSRGNAFRRHYLAGAFCRAQSVPAFAGLLFFIRHTLVVRTSSLTAMYQQLESANGVCKSNHPNQISKQEHGTLFQRAYKGGDEGEVGGGGMGNILWPFPLVPVRVNNVPAF